MDSDSRATLPYEITSLILEAFHTAGEISPSLRLVSHDFNCRVTPLLYSSFVLTAQNAQVSYTTNVMERLIALRYPCRYIIRSHCSSLEPYFWTHIRDEASVFELAQSEGLIFDEGEPQRQALVQRASDLVEHCNVLELDESFEAPFHSQWDLSFPKLRTIRYVFLSRR